jgi:hypothetical protein
MTSFPCAWPLAEIPQRFRSFRELVLPLDHRLHLSGFHEVREERQILVRQLGEEELLHRRTMGRASSSSGWI